MYLLVRLAFLTMVAMPQIFLMGCFFEAMLLTLTAILVGVVQPYKSNVHNAVDVVLILTTAISLVASIECFPYILPSDVLLCTFTLVPMFYIITVALYWLSYTTKKIPQKLCSKLRLCINVLGSFYAEIICVVVVFFTSHVD